MEEQYNYEGERFLDKLYKDLFNSEIVEHTKEKSDKREEAIKKYMDRLENTHKNATTENRKNMLKRLYYKKYVIKKENLPINLTNEQKEQIIENQKKSLDKWLDYLTDENAKYPMWAKYWVFQGMLKMGTYDEAHEVYQNRSKKTLAPFVDANPEIIASAIDILNQQLNKKNINDEELKKIIETGSFSKIYTILERKYKQTLQEKTDNTDGIWIKYNEGSEEEAIKLSKSLEGKNTGWCTANKDMAINQVCGEGGYDYDGGDFYVYYTKDKENNYTNPRIAIRMDGKNEIGEIRGIEESQNMEECMVPIIEEKLKQMNFLKQEDIEKNLKIINDLKKLSLINKKIAKNEEITAIELLELDYKKFGFGWEQDPRVKKIQNACKKNTNPKTLKNMLLFKPEKVKLIDNEILNEHPEIVMEVVKEEFDEIMSIIRNFTYEEKLDDKIEYEIGEHIMHNHILKYVGEEFKNSHPEIIMEAVKQVNYPNALCYVSEEFMQSHPKIVFEAVKPYESNAVEYVSEEFMKSHPEIVLEATKNYNDGKFIYVSEEFVQSHPEIVMEAVKQDESPITFDMSKNLIESHPEIVMEAVKQNSWRVFDMSKNLIESHPEIVMEAVKQNDKLLESLSEKYQIPHPKIALEIVIASLINKEVQNLNQKNVLETAKKDIASLIRLNAGLQKDYPEITWQNSKEFETTLEYVSKEFEEDESNKVCNTTKEYAPSLTFINEKFQENNSEIVIETVKQDGSKLEFVTEKFQENYPEVVIEAIKEYAPSLEYVSEKFQKTHPEIIFELVRQDGSLLEYVNEEFKNSHPEIIMEIVRQDGSLLEYLSEEFQKSHPEIVMEAIKEYAPSLEYISKEFQKIHPEIVIEAIKQDVDTIEFISEEFKNSHPEIALEIEKQTTRKHK